MEAVDKRKLRANYVQLVRNLNAEDVTDYLYQERVLTEEDIERIASQPVRAQRVRVLLSILPLRRKEGLAKLLEAMKENGYCELADKIEGTEDTEAEHGIDTRKALTKSVVHLHLIELKEQLEEQSQFVKALQCEIEEGQELKKEDLAGIIQTEELAKKDLVERVYNAVHLEQEQEEQEEQQEICVEIEDTDTVTASVEEGQLPATVTVPTHYHHTTIKCLVIGDGATGKTCLLMRCSYNKFPELYVPTVFENYATTATVLYNKVSTKVDISFWDTAGQEDYVRIRQAQYPGTDVVLITFSYTSHESLEHVINRWLPEIQRFLPDVPCILVGTMADPHSMASVASSRYKAVVKESQASCVALEHNFAGNEVFTTSALTGDGIKKLMDFMTQTGLRYQQQNNRSRHKERCNIL